MPCGSLAAVRLNERPSAQCFSEFAPTVSLGVWNGRQHLQQQQWYRLEQQMKGRVGQLVCDAARRQSMHAVFDDMDEWNSVVSFLGGRGGFEPPVRNRMTRER